MDLGFKKQKNAFGNFKFLFFPHNSLSNGNDNHIFSIAGVPGTRKLGQVNAIFSMELNYLAAIKER